MAFRLNNTNLINDDMTSLQDQKDALYDLNIEQCRMGSSAQSFQLIYYTPSLKFVGGSEEGLIHGMPVTADTNNTTSTITCNWFLVVYN